MDCDDKEYRVIETWVHVGIMAKDGNLNTYCR
jgi:hypothetical protein